MAKSKKQKVAINRSIKELNAQAAFSDWFEAEEEGELSVDVFQDKDNIYVKSTVAGVKPENLEISVNNDMLTIHGFRQKEERVAQDDYFCQECFWGKFSRSVILPVNVRTDQIAATLEDGVLTIKLPKIKHQRNIPIMVKKE